MSLWVLDPSELKMATRFTCFLVNLTQLIKNASFEVFPD